MNQERSPDHRRRIRHPLLAPGNPGGRGLLRPDRRHRRGGTGSLSRPELRPGPPRHLAPRNERPRSAGRNPASEERPAGRRHLRPRHRGDGGQGRQDGRLRFPRKAPLPREGRPDRPQRPPPGPAGGGERPAARTVQDRLHLVGKSAAIRKLRAGHRDAAPTDGRILLSGENGTGKELSPPSSTCRAAGGTAVSSRSTARPSRTTSSTPSSSDISRVTAPTRPRKRRARSCWPTAGPSSWTRSAKCPSRPRPSSSASSSRGITSRSGGPSRSRSTPASSPRPGSTSATWSPGTLQRGSLLQDQRHPAESSRRSGSGPRTSPCSSPISCGSTAGEYGRKPKTIHPEAREAFVNYSWPGNVASS